MSHHETTSLRDKLRAGKVIHPVLIREGLLIAVPIKRFQKDGIGITSIGRIGLGHKVGGY